MPRISFSKRELGFKLCKLLFWKCADSLNHQNCFLNLFCYISELCAFQLTEMYGLHVPPCEFQQKYVENVSKLMNARQIYNGVVATHNPKRIRYCMIRENTFVLLNCADSESKLTDFYDSSKILLFFPRKIQTKIKVDFEFFEIKWNKSIWSNWTLG